MLVSCPKYLGELTEHLGELSKNSGELTNLYWSELVFGELSWYPENEALGIVFRVLFEYIMHSLHKGSRQMSSKVSMLTKAVLKSKVQKDDYCKGVWKKMKK